MTPAVISLEYEEVHDVSVDLLRFLEVEEVEVGTAVAALALSFGRLLSPVKPMADDAEIHFMQQIMEWAGMYFAEGRTH